MTNWAKKLAELIAATVMMVLAALAALIGIDDTRTVEKAKRAAAAFRAVAPGVVEGAAAAGRGLGRALTLPLHAVDLSANAVGATLGAFLPRPPVTARQVADGAVERDDARTHRADPEYHAAREGLVAASLVGIRVQGAASSLLSRGGPLHAIYSDELTPTVRAWLEELTPAQLKAVVDAPAHALDRHINADAQTDLLPGVPRVLSTMARLAKEATGANELDMEAMIARAKANLRNSGREAEEMMKRGTFRRPPEEPEAGQVVPIRGPRPTPRPSFG